MLFDSEFMFRRIVSVDGNLHLLGAGIDPPLTSLKLPAGFPHRHATESFPIPDSWVQLSLRNLPLILICPEYNHLFLQSGSFCFTS